MGTDYENGLKLVSYFMLRLLKQFHSSQITAGILGLPVIRQRIDGRPEEGQEKRSGLFMDMVVFHVNQHHCCLFSFLVRNKISVEITFWHAFFL